MTTRHKRTAVGEGAVDGPTSPTASQRYDAFISYSHEIDTPVASALQTELQRFAKPWYRRRALRVFRDDANLSAHPGLWPAIQAALDGSRIFILLASPKSAASPWVVREIEYWLEHKSPETLLIALTDGELQWEPDGAAIDMARSTALPPSLAEQFPQEPRLVDLRWVRPAPEAAARDPRLREVVADLAAPLHGRSKDELIGEDLRQHRRMMRWRNIAIVTLSLLLMITTATSVVAVQQRNTAIAQRDAALAKQLASQSRILLNVQPQVAALLAAEAYQRLPAPETTTALLEVSALPENLITPPPKPGGLFFNEDDARVLASVNNDRSITMWDLPTATPLYTLPPAPAPIQSVNFNAAAQLVAVVSGWRYPFGGLYGSTEDWPYRFDQITLWDSGTGSPRGTFTDMPGYVTSIDFSPDGKQLAASTGHITVDKFDTKPNALPTPGTPLDVAGETRIWTIGTDSPFRSIPGPPGHTKPHWTDPVDQAYFSPDGSTLFTTNHYSNDVTLWNANTLTQTGSVKPEITGRTEIVGTIPMPNAQMALMLSDESSPTANTRDAAVTIEVWDQKAGSRIRTLQTEAFSRAIYDTNDNTLVAVGSLTGNYTKWDLVSTQPSIKATGPKGLGGALYSDLASDGSMIAYSRIKQGTSEYETALWDLAPERVIQKICQQQQRSLTTEEWNIYVGPGYPHHRTCQ